MSSLKTLIFAVCICLLSAGQSFAQSTTDPEPPDISAWKLISKSNISIRVSDKVKYNLGFDLTYQNPQDPNEFVRQIRILLPFIIVKNTSVMDRHFADMAVAYVTDGAEKELLKNYSEKSDPVLTVRWKIGNDAKREVPKLEGANEVWFWNASGNRVYLVDSKIQIDMLSETFKEFENDLVVVGLKYSLNKANYRAHEVPHEFLIMAIRSSKGGK